MAYGILMHGNNRPDIVYTDGTIRGGLHCGDCIEIFIKEWILARIEYDDSWIIIVNGRKEPVPYGCRCRD